MKPLDRSHWGFRERLGVRLGNRLWERLGDRLWERLGNRLRVRLGDKGLIGREDR